MDIQLENMKIFFSYAREDEEQVKALYNKLSNLGLKPWMDRKDLVGGEKWKSAINSAIKESTFFLAFLSNNSINKRGVIQREIKEALDVFKDKLDDDIYLIPIRLDECKVPEILSTFQWVDLFEQKGFEKLMQAFEKGLKKLKVDQTLASKDSRLKNKSTSNKQQEASIEMRVPESHNASSFKMVVKLSWIISAIVLFVGISYSIYKLINNDPHGDDFYIVNCPDGEPVKIIKNIEKAYPTYARNYTANFNVLSSQLTSLSVNVKTDIVKLRQDLNQENIALENKLKTAVFALQMTPCDKSVRKRYWEILAEINLRADELENFTKGISIYSNDKSRLQLAIDTLKQTLK